MQLQIPNTTSPPVPALDPKDAEDARVSMWRTALELFADKNFVQAEETLKKLVSSIVGHEYKYTPNVLVGIRLNLSQCLCNNEKFDEALQAAEVAQSIVVACGLSRSKLAAHVANQKGYVLIQLGLREEAGLWLNKALEGMSLDPLAMAGGELEPILANLQTLYGASA